MKKIKESKSYEDVRKYHYTVGIYLSQIIESEQIKLATLGCRKKREHAVWVSTNEFWEETANKGFKDSDGNIIWGDRSLTHFNGGGLVRIEIRSETAPYSWGNYVQKSKMPSKMRKRLSLSAKSMGADPRGWYVSYEPIKKDDWLSIELFNQKNSSMLCIGVKKIKIHFDTSQLCCGVVHLGNSKLGTYSINWKLINNS